MQLVELELILIDEWFWKKPNLNKKKNYFLTAVKWH